MKFSKTRLSEIENPPDDTIDTSDIPELDGDFWENVQRIVPENYLNVDALLTWNYKHIANLNKETQMHNSSREI